MLGLAQVFIERAIERKMDFNSIKGGYELRSGWERRKRWQFLNEMSLLDDDGRKLPRI